MRNIEVSRRMRCILHLDMDAFYASVEQLDHPEYRNRPVIVGGSDRGVVCAASYEVRRYGVHSAMPMFQARKLCLRAVVLPVRMGRYKEVSREVMALLRTVSPLVEPLSIDEAFVDITGTETLFGPPRELAVRLKADIAEKTGLTCSVGIAPNKLIAKIASDLDKPDGLTVVPADEVAAFMKNLPVSKIPGFGKRAVSTLEDLGVRTGADVMRYPLSFWLKRFGKNGLQLHEKAQGIDNSPVLPDRAAKSIGAENTYPSDTANREEIERWLLIQTERVSRELRKKSLKGRTVTLKVKYSDFKTITRSRSLFHATDSTATLYDTVLNLFGNVPKQRSVRLTGVSVSQLDQGFRQIQLFRDPEDEKQQSLDRAFDKIRDKYGNDMLQRGRLFGSEKED